MSATASEMKNNLEVCCLQQSIVWGNKTQNYERVERLLSESRCETADVVIVPEVFTTGFGDALAAQAEEPEGATLDFARRMAARFDTLFVGSWCVRCGDAVYNRMHLVMPDGNYHTYDKAHTFRMSSEAEQVRRGTERNVVEWRGWRLRPAVCYDLRFPIWLRNWLRDASDGGAVGEADEPATRLDYDLLVVNANWPRSRREAWSTLLRARAIENQCYVAGANCVGTGDNEVCYTGDSAIVNYTGSVLAQAEAGCEQVLRASLPFEKLLSFRRRWPFYLDFD